MQGKTIYEVRYRESWEGSNEWMEAAKTVLAGGDAQVAIDRCKEAVLTQTISEDGKTLRIDGFELISVTVVAQAEI